MNRILLIFLFLFPLISTAQDIHLSHIHASPTLLNPAMTGLFDGDVRFMSNFKSQWNNVTNGYKTMVGSLDMKFGQTNKDNVFGGGLILYSDKAGDLDFRTTSVNLTFSVLRSLNNEGNHYLSFGIQNSFTTNKVNFANIIARDLEPAIAEGALNKINYWDISAGAGWFYAFDKHNSMYLGFSVFHITEPFVSFFEDRTAGNYIFRKYIIHGGADIDLGKRVSFKPNFIFLDQGPHKEITQGAFLKYSNKSRTVRKNSSPVSVYLGAWLRWYLESEFVGVDALIASFRLDYQNTFLTFSYDLNISNYNRVSFGRGGPELSLVKTIDLGRRKRRTSKVKCPAFYY